MADNLVLNPASGGATLRADQIPGDSTYVPYSKILDGTADSTNAWTIDSSGRGKVLLDAGSGTVVEDTASAGGETSLLIAGVRNDTAAAKTSTDGDFGNIAIDSAGRVGVTDLGGTISIDDGGGSLTVDGSVSITGTPTVTVSGTVTVSVSGTATVADNQTITDNAGFTDGTSKVFMGGYILDEVAGTALTENDAAAARIDSKRAQVLVIEDATTRGQRAAVSAGGALSVALAANQSVNVAQVAGTATDTNSGNKSAGTQRVVLATDQPQLTNALKVDPSGVTSPVSIAATVKTQQTPGTSGGYSVSRLLSAASTNATSVKASAGQVYGLYVFNAAASTRYVKLYNKASAPTVGTDTPFMTIPIPAGGGAVADWDGGVAMGTGIAFAITGGVADNDSTAVAANDVILNLLYA